MTDGESRLTDGDARELLLELKRGLDTEQVTQQTSPGISEHRGAVAPIRDLIVGGINLGVFAAMFEIAKLWLPQRSTCEITLK